MRNQTEEVRNLYAKYKGPVQKFMSEELIPSLLFTLNDRVDKGDFLNSWLHNYNVMKNIQKNYNYDFKTINELDFHISEVEKQVKRNKLDPEYYVPLSIAYSSYGNNKAQSFINDFSPFRNRIGLPPVIRVSDYFYNQTQSLHKDERYYNDLPHTMVAYATYKRQSKSDISGSLIRFPFKSDEAINMISYLQPNYPGRSWPSDLSQLLDTPLLTLLVNSISGDILQLIDNKDWVSDMDALYLALSPMSSDLSFRKRLFNVLGQPRWNLKRDTEVIKLFPGESYSQKESMFFTAIALGMFTLAGFQIATRIRQDGQKEASIEFLKKKKSELDRLKINEKRREISETRKAMSSIVRPVKRLVNTVIPQQILTPIKKAVGAISKNVGFVVNRYNNMLFDRYIKRPITNVMKRWFGR